MEAPPDFQLDSGHTLVWGNHDDRLIARLFAEVLDQGLITVEGQPIWLNHYPMRTWHKSHYGSWHLYGHVHGRLVAEDVATPHRLTRDVGVDACGYRPVDFEDIRGYMAPRIEEFHRRRAALANDEEDSDRS